MKKVFFKISMIVFSIVYLASCGGSKTVNNEFLGKLPSLEKNFAEKISSKEEALKNAKNLSRAFTISKEIEELKEERKVKINEYLEATPLVKPLPFKALDDTPYTINQVVVNSASIGNLKLGFDITVNEDIKNTFGWGLASHLTIYFKALDKNGDEIPNSKGVAANSEFVQLVAGTEIETFGSWFSMAIRNLEDFANVVEITKEEYESR